MLHEWTLHDLGHIRQIAELVRARKYLADAGPLGELLPVEAMMFRLGVLTIAPAWLFADVTPEHMRRPLSRCQLA